jgi:glycerol-3-phosphate acyltransferase PlsX
VARIAVDAMGGDRAPGEIVHGTLAAARNGIDAVLVGDPELITAQLAAVGAADTIGVVPATQVIEMGEDAASAIRDKKDASVTVAARLVASGEAEGMVSDGSTGAAMAAAVFVVGRLHGVSRPAIATLLPIGKVIIDAGANVSCRPEHLVQFSLMGSLLATSHFGLPDPKVGLLNIGEEVGKGRDLEKEAHGLLTDVPGINFVGNVEGRDLAGDRVDVIVTDGFTGNVMLKTAEGAARLTMRAMLEAVSGPEYQDALAALAPPLMALRARLDPESTGGASLLGVRGNVVIAHGSSSRVAIENAITLAAESAEHHVPAQIEKRLAATSSVV